MQNEIIKKKLRKIHTKRWRLVAKISGVAAAKMFVSFS
jgi:hypothetical protein